MVPWPSALVLTLLIPDFSESNFGLLPPIPQSQWLVAAEVSYNLLHNPVRTLFNFFSEAGEMVQWLAPLLLF